MNIAGRVPGVAWFALFTGLAYLAWALVLVVHP